MHTVSRIKYTNISYKRYFNSKPSTNPLNSLRYPAVYAAIHNMNWLNWIWQFSFCIECCVSISWSYFLLRSNIDLSNMQIKHLHKVSTTHVTPLVSMFKTKMCVNSNKTKITTSKFVITIVSLRMWLLKITVEFLFSIDDKYQVFNCWKCDKCPVLSCWCSVIA